MHLFKAGLAHQNNNPKKKPCHELCSHSPLWDMVIPLKLRTSLSQKNIHIPKERLSHPNPTTQHIMSVRVELTGTRLHTPLLG